MNVTTKTLTLTDEAWTILEQQAQDAGMPVQIYLHSVIISHRAIYARLSDAIGHIAKYTWDDSLTNAEVRSLVKNHPSVLQAFRESQAQNPTSAPMPTTPDFKPPGVVYTTTPTLYHSPVPVAYVTPTGSTSTVPLTPQGE